MKILPILLLLALSLGCQTPAADQAPAAGAAAPAAVRTGAQVLADEDFRFLAGKRVGLIVNHTARVDTLHLADAIHAAPDVTLGALFGPEHGLRGTADAGATVADGRDDRTGVPIYSLYGNTRKPRPDMLVGLQMLVFDIQDVGARFYTYISTMGLAMQAAAEADIPFVVLDRPNPLGGAYVSGFVLEPGHTSFVGQYPIPIAHGLTVGELAQMIQGEGWLPGLENLALHVVKMDDWEREMRWPETGLPWIPPSPNIPDFETALIYPGTCFFEATAASEGRGTRTPFRLLGAPWADGTELVAQLGPLPGLAVDSARFTPRSIEGMSSTPKLQDQPLGGLRLRILDPALVHPVEAGMQILYTFYQQAPDQADFLNDRWLARLAGTDRLATLLRRDALPAAIAQAWADEVEAFRAQREPYLLY